MKRQGINLYINNILQGLTRNIGKLGDGRQIYLILLGLVILWFVLNTFILTYWPPFDFNGDEAWLLDYLLHHGKTEMLLGFDAASDGLKIFNTPLYFGYARFFLWIFGQDIWGLRLSSLVAGAASLILTYLLASEIDSPKGGLLAVVILALSGPFIYTSHYLRWESLSLVFGLTCTWLFIRGTRKQEFNLALAGLTASLSVLVQPVNALFPVALFVSSILLLKDRKKRLWTWLGLAVGFIIWLSSNFFPFWRDPFPQVFGGYSKPIIVLLLIQYSKIPILLLKLIYKPIMFITEGAEYGSLFLSPIVGALFLLSFLFKSRLRYLLLSLMIGFGLFAIKQEYINIIFPFIIVGAVFSLNRLRRIGIGPGAVLLLATLIPELYLLQGEIRMGKKHFLARKSMFATVEKIIPAGAKVVSTSPCLIWSGLKQDYQVFRLADSLYLVGERGLYSTLTTYGINYLVVDIMQTYSKQKPSYYYIGYVNRNEISDTSLFKPLGKFPAGYLFHASKSLDNMVDSFAIYQVKAPVSPQ